MCSTTINNFYEPLRKLIVRKQAARDMNLSMQGSFNLQQVVSFEVKTVGSGVDWFLGVSAEKKKRMAPTHARIITPFVPLGIFTEEQRESVIEVSLVSSPYDENLYCIPGSQHAFSSCFVLKF